MATVAWLVGVALAASLSTADTDAMVHRSRVLLVFPSREDDADLAAQRSMYADAREQMAARDVVLTIDTAGNSLPIQYGVQPTGFAALLIGRDGGVKLRSHGPIPAARLIAEIDRMPMRRREMRQH